MSGNGSAVLLEQKGGRRAGTHEGQERGADRWARREARIRPPTAGKPGGKSPFVQAMGGRTTSSAAPGPRGSWELRPISSRFLPPYRFRGAETEAGPCPMGARQRRVAGSTLSRFTQERTPRPDAVRRAPAGEAEPGRAGRPQPGAIRCAPASDFGSAAQADPFSRRRTQQA